MIRATSCDKCSKGLLLAYIETLLKEIDQREAKTVETVVTMLDIARDAETEWNRVFMCEWLKNEILQHFKLSPDMVKIAEPLHKPKEQLKP